MADHCKSPLVLLPFLNNFIAKHLNRKIKSVAKEGLIYYTGDACIYQSDNTT